MAKSTHTQLVSDIRGFLKSHGMAPTRFGILATGDPSLVADLEAGRDLRSRTLDRVRSFMAEYKGGPQPRRGRPTLCSVA